VSFDDWMLALHVLSAVAFVSGMVLFWVLIVAVRRIDTPDETLRFGPLAKVGNAAVGIGMGGTIVLGIWLAFSVGGYDIWDGWILAALVLWLIAAELGRRTGAAYEEGPRKAEELEAAGQTGPSAELLAVNRTSTGLLMHTLTSIVVALIIIDMVWKPGA
jgi:uncharacterized membrane protein